MPKLCPKIILEGTRLTWKTDIAFALNEHPRIVGPRKYRYHSPLISGEWCAFTNVPWGRGLINFAPAEEKLAMDTYHTWATLFTQLKYYSWIIDRFHLSTKVYQSIHQGKKYDFRWLEDQLLTLGFRIVLLTRSAESFAEARQARLAVSGKPSQYDDLGVFIKEQEAFQEAIRSTILPWKEFDVTTATVPELTEKVADWLEATGGLIMV
jgi:hypothetical protein